MIEYEINLSGSQCSVVEWNPSGSILVFALHGWLDNLATFESLVQHMPEIRLVAFDFPGHGHSQHLAAGSAYHFLDGIFLVDDLARHFKQDKFHLLGHSMGGAVATLYAASQSTRVTSVVLIESVGPLTATAEDSLRLLQRAVSERALLVEKAKPIYERFSQALAARALASNITGELIKPIVERGLTKVEGGYTWRADSRLRISSASRLSEPQLEAILSQLSCPVMLVEGSSGYLVDNPAAQARKGLFKQFDCVVLEGGHHVHLQQPLACAEKIAAFFKAHS